jgi:hypothetical protein
MNKREWLLIGAYKPPTVPENIFTSDFIKCLDQVTCNYDNFMVLRVQLFMFRYAHMRRFGWFRLVSVNFSKIS